ncbi:hypothetical protein TRFO_41591 [Tritrichomonas foetus]|uniref:Protein kinase domain-containing protein n=1 Tax=Tritrichomonas foetus TaxID=1144522 RepID=A0A1J4L494_9EUKA|nr:hypothetical protein TRFO_41591 [Tritrichomonas foetus]|eukprot:OHT16766.1 hypothetical protein TRFO_41591 [Tritrichomonas foetus]
MGDHFVNLSYRRHRDIKAENILLDSNFHIKISDFGLSHSYQHDILKTQCGSPNYLAPEIINNQLYGPPVDIWSAGVLLFLASTGNFPFIGDNMPKLFRKILSEKVGFPDFLSLELRDLLEKMLEKNPQDRITIEQILSHKWLSNQIPKKSVSLPSLSGNITKQDMISAVSLELEKYGFDAEEVAGKLHIKDKEYLMIASILTKRIESQQRAKNANRNAKKIPMMGKSHVVSGLINKGNIYSLENNPSIKANASNAKANLIFDAQFNQTNAQNTQNHPNTFDQENRQSLQNNPNTFDQENRQNGITNTVINSDVVQPSVTSPGNKNLASTGCLPNESFHHGSRLSTICKKSQSSFGINLDRNQLSLVQRNIRSKNYRHLINKHISMDFLHLQPNGNQTNTFLETPNQDDSQNFNNIPEDETIMNNANDGKDNSNKATSGEKVRIITQTEEVPKMVISEGAGSRLLKFGIIRERHKSNNV